MTISPQSKQAVLSQLPPERPHALRPAIREQVVARQQTIVVLDDDPTGTQTVHGVPVLTEWGVDLLSDLLAQNDVSLFYLLTNSRSLLEPEARTINAEIGRHLREAAQRTQRDFVVVSRSDSTLRGHFPSEVNALAQGIGHTFDAWLLIPFFLEGGRYTIDDVHYVAEGEQLIPAAATPFARDEVFGYTASNLRQWVHEKSGGAIQHVTSITIEELRQQPPAHIAQRLLDLEAGAVCVVNAASYGDLEALVMGLLTAEEAGKRYLYRTAASFVPVRAGLDPKPLLTAAELFATPPATPTGGLIVIGSYVPQTTQQIEYLLTQDSVTSLEIEVRQLLDAAQRPAEIQRVARAAEQQLRQGRDVALYTSRQLITGGDHARSLNIGNVISSGLVEIVRAIQTQPRYLLAKGGITSSDIATQGLNVKQATVLGQLRPGVPVWRTGADSRYPDLPYIVFPGNVGRVETLGEVVGQLQQEAIV